jgi:signal transduction histidine kinase
MAAISRLESEQKIQELSIRQKSTMNYILMGSLAVLLIIGSLLYAYTRKKQQLSYQTEQLQAQRIKELEQEKQLIAFDSLLKGQEEERSRLAKDLHDGLGGMLSGVKLSLSAMKGNIILTEDNARLFTKALDQLDNSIGEMRRVAHNMMPEALVKFGLQQAVQDYCEGLSESQQLKIKCQYHGLETRMEPATEIIIYRIIQELLNNIVKHAQASEGLVQIMRHDTSVAITVEDNGKGFDPAKLEFQKGAGLSNVRSRVDYLKGQLDIRSEAGKGTSVHIECSLTES